MTNEFSKSPHFKVEVDSKEVSAQVLATIESVVFEEEINTASMFILKLSVSDLSSISLGYLELGEFKIGSEVKISMGMEELQQMIVGEITSIEPSFNRGFCTIEMRGFDRLHRLGLGKNQKTFAEVKDSDIASHIAQDRGLRYEVEDTGTIYQNIYQNNRSDFEFLIDRAKRIRYEVMVNDRKLIFRKAKENDPVSLTLEYMINLDEFFGKLSARYEGNEIVVQGWDFMKKEPISAKGRSGDKVSMMSADETGISMTSSAFGASSSAIVGVHILDASDAEKLAVAGYNAQLVEFVTGEGKCAGIPELRYGKNIEIKGMGRFSGIYYVTSTSHIIDNNGYNTSFRVRRVGI